MGFFDFLFGEGPSVDTQTLDTLTPEQQRSLNQLLVQLGGSSATFGGDTQVDPSDLSQLSLSALEERASALGNPNRDNELAQSASDTLLKFLNFDNGDAGINDFFNTNVRDPALKEFQENILPAISRDFGGANFFGSERAGTDARAQNDLIRSLTQARSGLAFNAREGDRNRALQALGLAPSVDALGRSDTNELLQLLQAGELQTGLSERNAARDFQRFLSENQIDENRINQLLAAINTQGIENVVTAQGGSSGFLSALVSALSGTDFSGIFKQDTPNVSRSSGKRSPTSLPPFPTLPDLSTTIGG